jgi:hypothetical protein
VHLEAQDRASNGDIAAHVLPLELPDIVSKGDAVGPDADVGAKEVSGASFHAPEDATIVDMDWDASSARLALALDGGPRDGVVAVYATRVANVVAASLIGYFDAKDASSGERVRARALKFSVPHASFSKRTISSKLAVSFENGDIACVPFAYAPSTSAA